MPTSISLASSVVLKLAAVVSASAPMTNSSTAPLALAASTARSVICVSLPSGRVKPIEMLWPSMIWAAGATAKVTPTSSPSGSVPGVGCVTVTSLLVVEMVDTFMPNGCTPSSDSFTVLVPTAWLVARRPRPSRPASAALRSLTTVLKPALPPCPFSNVSVSGSGALSVFAPPNR